MMPQDPGTGTTPSTDAAGDPAGNASSQSPAELYQDSLNSSLAAEESAQHTLDGLYAQGQALGAEPQDIDPNNGGPGPKEQAWLKQSQSLDRQIQAASNQLAQAKRNTSSIYTKIASDASTRARTQGQAAMWAGQAQNAAVAAQYKSDQAKLLEAYGAGLDKARIDQLQAQVAKDEQQVGLIAQQTQTSASQAALNSAKAVQLNELTPQVVQMDQGRTQNYYSQAAANSARAQYYTSRTSGPNSPGAIADANNQAKRDIATGNNRTSVQVADIKGLSQIEAWTIRQNANPKDPFIPNITQSSDGTYEVHWEPNQNYHPEVLGTPSKDEPNILTFDARNGQYQSQSNPLYVNQSLQGISDTNAAISEVQNEIANGTMKPEDGSALIDSLRQSLQYKAMGVTPDQYVSMQNQQAQMGRNTISGMNQLGSSMADSFMNAARNARTDFGPVTPYENAIKMMGGQSAMQQAFSLINQVQPITDRLSALKAAAQYGQASQILKSSLPPAQGQPGAAPTDSSQPPTDSGQVMPQPGSAGGDMSWLMNSSMSPIANPSNTGGSDNG